MHRFVAGICRMDLTLAPEGPWMVRGETIKETFSARSQQRTRDVITPLALDEGRAILPASSIKGVLRSTTERILRTVDACKDPDRVPLADDPFVHGDDIDLTTLKRSEIADSEVLDWYERLNIDPPFGPSTIYPHLTAATQLFGATTHAGLLMLDDAIVSVKAEPRSHVSIDRVTGGIGGSPYRERINSPKVLLKTTLTVTNFALWQIGLLGLVFQEASRGYVGFGAGTRKGQGQMKMEVTRIVFDYPNAAYQAYSGIISAQARVGRAPWNAQDVPLPVQRVEWPDDDPLILGRTLPWQDETADDWRTSDRTLLKLNTSEPIHDLFAEAVSRAWVPWLKEATQWSNL